MTARQKEYQHMNIRKFLRESFIDISLMILSGATWIARGGVGIVAEVVTYMNNHAGTMSVLATSVLVYITNRQVRLTKESLKLTKDQADTPRIVASLRNDRDAPTYLIACIENVGAGTAHNVEFQTNLPHLEISPGIKIEDIGFINRGIHYFSSGQKYEIHVNPNWEKAWTELMKTSLEIKITYSDSSGNSEKSVDAHLDFRAFVNVQKIESPIVGISESAYEISKDTRSISASTSGVIKNLNKLNYHPNVRFGDKVKTHKDLYGIINGKIVGELIPKGAICTILEVTRGDITIEWDNPPVLDERVVYRHRDIYNIPFDIVEMKLPPKASTVKSQVDKWEQLDRLMQSLIESVKKS